jgi:hypothetical protein
MSAQVKPRCANIKSRKIAKERCTYPATKGEFCCRHWKHPRRFAAEVTNFVTRSVHSMARKIQAWWRLRNGLALAANRSLAFFSRDLCHNDTEIATFEPLSTVARDYFFVIKEINRFWGFDIRSLVVQYEIEGCLTNPYTKSVCDQKTLETFRMRVDSLRKWKKPIQFEQPSGLSPKQSWSLRVLDMCLRLDMLGYRVATQWFTDLDITSQRQLYTVLYKMWNEQLSTVPDIRERIVPDNVTCKLFKWTPLKISMKFDIDSIRRTNLNVLERLISSAVVPSDKTLGAMYSVMSLCQVSSHCRRAYPWLC